MRRYGELPYYSLSQYLKEQFGEKLYKIALDAGMTCPNRDGSIDTRGCIFCSGQGSGEFAGDRRYSITEQINQASVSGNRMNAEHYIAYFQAFTNTYAPIEQLRAIYLEAISHPKVRAISIATRPDCISPETVLLLAECNRIKPVWVELGLQSIHEETAAYIRRGYSLPVFDEAVRLLKSYGIPVIVHVILGLPGEDKEAVLRTIHYLNRSGVKGIKLQLLHILSGTDLAAEYEAGRCKVLTQPEYVDMVVSCIGHLARDIVVHRLTGDGAAELLIEPMWSRNKRSVRNQIHHELRVRGIGQGDLL